MPRLPDLTWIRFPANVSEDYLATVDLSSCLGITFFFAGGGLHGIHAHTKAAPSAEATFAKLLPTIQSVAQWVYVPNPIDDKISAFGFRVKADYEGRLYLSECSYIVSHSPAI